MAKPHPGEQLSRALLESMPMHSPREKERMRHLVDQAHREHSAVHAAMIEVAPHPEPPANFRSSLPVNEEVLGLLVHAARELNAAQTRGGTPQTDLHRSKNASDQRWGYFTQTCIVRGASPEGAPIDVSAIAERQPLVDSDDDDDLGSQRVGKYMPASANNPLEAPEPHMKSDWRETARLRRMLKEQEEADKRKLLQAELERRKAEYLLQKQHAAASIIQNAWRVYRARSKQDLHRFMVLNSEEHRASEARLRKLIEMENELAESRRKVVEGSRLDAAERLRLDVLRAAQLAAGVPRSPQRTSTTFGTPPPPPPLASTSSFTFEAEASPTLKTKPFFQRRSKAPAASEGSGASEGVLLQDDSDDLAAPWSPDNNDNDSSGRPDSALSGAGGGGAGSVGAAEGDDAGEFSDSAQPLTPRMDAWPISPRAQQAFVPGAPSEPSRPMTQQGGERTPAGRPARQIGTAQIAGFSGRRARPGGRVTQAPREPPVRRPTPMKPPRQKGPGPPGSHPPAPAVAQVPRIQLSDVVLSNAVQSGAALAVARLSNRATHRQARSSDGALPSATVEVAVPESGVLGAAAAAAMQVLQTHGDAAAEDAAATVLTMAGEAPASATVFAAAICEAVSEAVEQEVAAVLASDSKLRANEWEEAERGAEDKGAEERQEGDWEGAGFGRQLLVEEVRDEGQADNGVGGHDGACAPFLLATAACPTHPVRPAFDAAAPRALETPPTRAELRHVGAATEGPRAAGDGCGHSPSAGSSTATSPSPLRVPRRTAQDILKYQEQGASKRDKATRLSPWVSNLSALDDSDYILTAHGWQLCDDVKLAMLEELLLPAPSAPYPLTLEWQQHWLAQRPSYQGLTRALTRPPSPAGQEALLADMERAGEASPWWVASPSGDSPAVVNMASAMLANTVEIAGTWCTPLHSNQAWTPTPPPAVAPRSTGPRRLGSPLAGSAHPLAPHRSGRGLTPTALPRHTPQASYGHAPQTSYSHSHPVPSSQLTHPRPHSSHAEQLLPSSGGSSNGSHHLPPAPLANALQQLLQAQQNDGATAAAPLPPPPAYVLLNGHTTQELPGGGGGGGGGGAGGLLEVRSLALPKATAIALTISPPSKPRHAGAAHSGTTHQGTAHEHIRATSATSASGGRDLNDPNDPNDPQLHPHHVLHLPPPQPSRSPDRESLASRQLSRRPSHSAASIVVTVSHPPPPLSHPPHHHPSMPTTPTTMTAPVDLPESLHPLTTTASEKKYGRRSISRNRSVPSFSLRASAMMRPSGGSGEGGGGGGDDDAEDNAEEPISPPDGGTVQYDQQDIRRDNHLHNHHPRRSVFHQHQRDSDVSLPSVSVPVPSFDLRRTRTSVDGGDGGGGGGGRARASVDGGGRRARVSGDSGGGRSHSSGDGGRVSASSGGGGGGNGSSGKVRASGDGGSGALLRPEASEPLLRRSDPSFHVGTSMKAPGGRQRNLASRQSQGQVSNESFGGPKMRTSLAGGVSFLDDLSAAVSPLWSRPATVNAPPGVGAMLLRHGPFTAGPLAPSNLSSSFNDRRHRSPQPASGVAIVGKASLGFNRVLGASLPRLAVGHGH